LGMQGTDQCREVFSCSLKSFFSWGKAETQEKFHIIHEALLWQYIHVRDLIF
jgi:hypothetical protein